ncbi:MAG TPA: hypothetical protein VES60_01190 [Nakamurella sp.]|nr:hypothetical protein [Nakamurella sp.]
MTVLLDGNVLIAITMTGPVHHEAAVRWFAGSPGPHATTPIKQCTLIRTTIRLGATPDEGIGLFGGADCCSRSRVLARCRSVHQRDLV